ncbi:MAG: FGGY-family carbohydrate kinase [Blautia sp.]|nr:FGGY-family carbohydrate kinase [Blautia sp.]MDY3998160.1 FGGY-family carbohydrate kinase [Blautia sp.]
MIAGIDLGTSSVKIICSDEGKVTARVQACYLSEADIPVTEQWIEAVCRAFRQLENVRDRITCVGLSSQVGTYIVNGEQVVSWQEPVGREELAEARRAFSEKTFEEEISMNHPDILSYPVPRIRWLKKQYGRTRSIMSVCQPKEWLLHFLTGKMISDPCSWRGLANQETACYSRKMLDFIGIDPDVLPPLSLPWKTAGKVTGKAASLTGLKEGAPVYLGCNDYYASLLGMGITRPGQMFDVTGTSEHIGVITETLQTDTKMVSSPYFRGNVLYGVTASSGASLDYGIRLFDLKSLSPDDYNRILAGMSAGKEPPLFLPYLNGERAPIFDEQARGVFFGISGETSREDMAYAVLEGVAFSVLDVYRHLKLPFTPEKMIISGGAAKNPVLNQIKADLLGIPAVTAGEPDTSAYGACILAALGEGMYPDMDTAVSRMCCYGSLVTPQEVPVLEKRFAIYRDVYQRIRPVFRGFIKL